MNMPPLVLIAALERCLLAACRRVVGLGWRKGLSTLSSGSADALACAGQCCPSNSPAAARGAGAGGRAVGLGSRVGVGGTLGERARAEGMMLWQGSVGVRLHSSMQQAWVGSGSRLMATSTDLPQPLRATQGSEEGAGTGGGEQRRPCGKLGPLAIIPGA